MALLKFSSFQPDLTDLDTDVSDRVQNVVPRADGYGPVPDFNAFTSALPGACRGYFRAINSDGSVSIFAATATNIYLLNNTNFTWTNVSLSGGPYAGLVSTDNWEFAQFNSVVIAVQIGVAPQAYTLGVSSAFANLGGSPPNASHVTNVNRFLVLSGLGSTTPYRIQWSGLNAITVWDNVTLLSNFQDLPDGGIVHRVAGGELGIIFQDASIRTMTFAPGSPYTFQIDRISQDDGIYYKYALVRATDEIHFISPQGFKKITPGGYPQPIGKEKVDRTFFADVDTGNLQLLMGAVDPTSTRVYWAYKSIAGKMGLIDTILVYDRVLDRWSKITGFSGEYVAATSKPGFTLEAMDTIASGIISITGATNNGGGLIRLTLSPGLVQTWTYGLPDTTHTAGQVGSTSLSNLPSTTQNTIEVYGVNGTTEANGNWHFNAVNPTHVDLIGSTFTNAYTSGGSIGGAIDSITFSLDAVSGGAQTQLSAFNSGHVLGFFNSINNMEAVIETTEADLGPKRIFINGIRPFTDANNVQGSLFVRDTAAGTSVQTTEQSLNVIGVCPQRIETRYARARIRIPYGTSWTYAMGVEPIDTVVGGER